MSIDNARTALLQTSQIVRDNLDLADCNRRAIVAEVCQKRCDHKERADHDPNAYSLIPDVHHLKVMVDPKAFSIEVTETNIICSFRASTADYVGLSNLRLLINIGGSVQTQPYNWSCRVTGLYKEEEFKSPEICACPPTEWVSVRQQKHPTQSAQERPTQSAPAPAEASPVEQDRAYKKRVRELWSWYQAVSMQRVTHMDGEETTHCWERLQRVKLKNLYNDNELVDFLTALRDQYLHGFTGKAQRK